MVLPIIQTNTVYHIGTLNKKDKCKYSDSYEGHLFSVSHCPDAWRTIAKLGNGNLYKLTIQQANFLDINSIKPQSKLYKTIIQFGLQEKLIEEQKRVKGWEYDDELETWRYSYYKNKIKAFDELNQDGKYENIADVPGPDGHSGIEDVKLWIGTKKLANMVKFSQLQDIDSFEFAALIWAETHTTLDGAWWNDIYEPDNLSAPRGGIFPHKLTDWNKEKTSWLNIPDDADMLFLYKKITIDLISDSPILQSALKL